MEKGKEFQIKLKFFDFLNSMHNVHCIYTLTNCFHKKYHANFSDKTH